MITLPECKLVGVFGPVASGKTHLIRQWIHSLNRFVVFDYTGEFEGSESLETIIANPKEMYLRLKKNPYYFRIAYVPGRNVELDFNYVLWSLWYIDSYKYLVCDEFHRICPVTLTNDELGTTVETMLRFARHAHLGLVGVSQRIADVSKLFTSACRMVVLFKTQEARDLIAIDDRWHCADMVSNLRGLIFDDQKNQVIQIPECVVIEQGKSPRVESL